MNEPTTRNTSNNTAQVQSVQKRRSDEDYLLSLLASNSKVTEITTKKTINKEGDEGTDFLIHEYNSLTDLWKHTDARFESGVNIYLTASALVISAIVFLSQQISDELIFLSITAFATASLSITGILLSSRLLSAALSKALYIFSRDAIRQYFGDTYPHIAPFLYFYRDSSFRTTNSKLDPSVVKVPQNILLVLHLWIAFLVWVSCTITLWVLFQPQSVQWIFVSSLVGALFLFALLTISTRRRIEDFIKRTQVL